MSKTGHAPPSVGQVLAGKYRIERVLGSGGMGVVVAARHLDLRELRAIKLMHPERAHDTRAVERFLQEARAAVRLDGEHVARVLDVGRLESGAPFIVMEHLTGNDLGKIAKRGPLPIKEAAVYVAQAASAIAEAHAAGIVHRDLKPSNLFLTTARDGSPCIKVLDFGISKIATPHGDAALDMTRTREILGSPLYMAPEQMRCHHAADARLDVWGLGVILYKLVTGKLPFLAQGLLEVCTAVLEQDPVPPSSLRPDLPPELEAVILRCLVKDPAGRLASAAELSAALAPFAEIRPGAEQGPVDPAGEMDAPLSVPARTSAFEIGEADIPVELLDEPEGAPLPEPPEAPALAAERRAPTPTDSPDPPARARRTRRRRARTASAALAAVLGGILGSSTVLAGGGALVSRHEQPGVSSPAPGARKAPEPLHGDPMPQASAEPSAARAGATPARPRPFFAGACPAVPKRPAPSPGGPDDPFRMLDRPAP